MRIFENKSIFKKLIIVLLVIMLFSFCIPKEVRAEDGVGGKLLNPVMSLFVGLGDGAMAILQKIIFHSNNSLINIDTSADFWSKFIVIAAAVLLAAVAIVACIFTGGGAAVVALGIIKITLVTGVITTITFPLTTTLVEGMLPESFYLPLYSITPQEIFSNKIPLLDVDFFNPTDSIDLEDGTTMESTAYQLKNTVANWYIILRDISLVALLSVLVYIGIRILISSTSSDKAKYKQMLVDWIVAICLLFAMHYIMSFSNLLIERIIDIIDSTQINTQEEDTEVKEPEMFEITDTDVVDKAYETLVEKPAEDGEISSEEDSPYYAFFVDDNGNTAGSDSTKLLWPAENFMQQARINLQLLEDDTETYVAIGWKLIYVVLVIFTLIFVFTYLKRLVYMTFLTIIAPLVALTYPIDKINDGKAQAFNMWFKEYIFNLLIQPMHLILYTILISSAMDFASQNALYVVVALGFMIPAEKLMRSFFGFEKAKTPGLLGGPAGAALMMNGMNKLFGRGSKGGKNSGGKAGSSKEISETNDKKINFKNAPDMIGGAEENDNIATIGQNDGNGILSTSGKALSQGGGNNLQNVNNKPQYIEDKILGWAGDKKDAIGEKIGNVKDSINNNSKVQSVKSFAGKTIGKPIRGIRALPKHSRFVNAGLQGTKRHMYNLGNRIRQYNPVKTAGKVAAVAAKGVTGGAIGLVGGTVAGIASGDITKGIQYATAGALGGYKVADSIGDSISNRFSNSGIKEAMSEGYYGDDYDQHLIDKKIKEVQDNYQNREKVLKNFDGDKKKAKEFMKDVVPDYVNYGVTDMKDIMAGYKLEESGIDRNRAISVATSVNDYGKNTSKLGAKDSEDLDKTLRNKARKNKNLNEKDVDKVAIDTRNLMDKYSKIKYKS